ncbi:winged helix DNA-binding domain-containing protein [Williamsia sterculiae]|uniref:winged helix DNA-binding domain-containing protein n=1 Tax=Williamsia sterculiae TaxID=1344003 RepID=UPI001F213A7D|nr:winged helix DNA-binding domain-containing protein [Williamsia sterculiae]
MGPPEARDVKISLRQWNRTLLTRQHLTARIDEDLLEVLDRCVGLQSQDPRAAFVGLWSRIGDFVPADLDALLTDREVVRMASLRSTLFLMDAEDARWVRSAAQPALDAEVRTAHAKRLVRAAPAEIVDDARAVLSGTALSGRDLGIALAERRPDEAPGTLVAIARCGLPLVQIPPRGLWRRSGGPTYALFDDWVGPGDPALTGDEARAELIRLYLRGFGPATVAGIQTWAGLTGLGPLVEAMEADWELERIEGPDGEELFDLDGLGVADEDTPAPVRLVAPYDNIVFAQADRRRVIDEDVMAAIATPNGRSPGFVLVDGRVSGTWSVGADDAVAVDLLRPVGTRDRAAVDAEVDLLTTLLRTPPGT